MVFGGASSRAGIVGTRLAEKIASTQCSILYIIPWICP